jgi:hexosaminidase
VRKPSTYSFLDDVLREVAALTPGPYIHIGGDEAAGTAPADYVRFIKRTQGLVARYGKHVIGWDEVARAQLLPTTVVQHWDGAGASTAAGRGAQVIMSPADHAYLDQKYNASTRLGLSWAGYVSVERAYRWDPVNVLPGVGARNVLGVEAPLWTETITNRADMDYMFFPLLIGIAEIVGRRGPAVTGASTAYGSARRATASTRSGSTTSALRNPLALRRAPDRQRRRDAQRQAGAWGPGRASPLS